MEAFSRLKTRLNKGNPAGSREAKPPATATPTTPSGQSSTTSPSPVAQSKVAHLPVSQVTPRRPPAQSWPVRLVSPRFGIQVTVYQYLAGRSQSIPSQTISELQMWTFISSGLQAIAGGELVLVVQRRSNESPDSYPIDFLRICDTVYDRASRQHLILKRWMLIELGEPLFNRPEFRTIALGFRNSPLFGLRSVALEKNRIPHLYCLPLGDQEVVAARKCGLVRALVNIDPESPLFPFPFYVDRDRRVTLVPDPMKDSVTTCDNFTKLEVAGLNVIQADTGQVTLHVPQDRVWDFKTAMAAKRHMSINSLLIQSDMHDVCQCVYLWRPGGESSVVKTMTNRSATNIAANFLIVSFNQSSEAVKLVEDGFLGKACISQSQTWSCQLTFPP